MQNSVSYCVREEKACMKWAEKYFKDCLCNLKDELSFGFGLISLVFWGVAEIPQIITNFRSKSGHGISLFFLLTWVAGDIFNLVGCLLEPATLPTQFYTAVLYTTTTVVLVLQSIYYDYFRNKLHRNVQHKDQSHYSQVEDVKKPLRAAETQFDSAIPIPYGSRRAVPRRSETYYYTSARSMASGTTPPIRSNLWPIKSGPSAVGLDNDSSSEDESDPPMPIQPTNVVLTKPKPIPRSAGYGAFLATSINMPKQTNALMHVYLGFAARKLLLQEEEGSAGSVYGEWLGWMMAVIYMGGRIPQIWLNIKRGSVEGLNPLMFIFALAANAAYVASILVRTIDWDKIKPNMPWLLDAGVCVLLDIFIILQYVYYRYLKEGK